MITQVEEIIYIILYSVMGLSIIGYGIKSVIFDKIHSECIECTVFGWLIIVFAILFGIFAFTPRNEDMLLMENILVWMSRGFVVVVIMVITYYSIQDIRFKIKRNKAKKQMV